LIVNGSEFDSLKSMIGARFAYPIQLESGRRLVPEARVVWSHEFLDDQSTFVAAPVFAPGATFLVQGEEYSRDSIIVGTGLSAPLSDQTTIFIDYDAGLNADITTHTVSAGFRTRW
jgi:outer membrane autotransporter protein